MERASSGGVGAMLPRRIICVVGVGMAWCGLIDVTPFFSACC